MSETDTDTTTGRTETDRTPPDADDEGSRDLRHRLNQAVLAGLVLLGLIAAIRFYLAAGSTIDRWVVAEYRSLFHAAFNLAVLLLAAGGVSFQLRRLR